MDWRVFLAIFISLLSIGMRMRGTGGNIYAAASIKDTAFRQSPTEDRKIQETFDDLGPTQ
jgi:hypothetical protein